MMRLLLLTCAFVGATGALVIALLPPLEEAPLPDAVTRAQSAPFSLQPAVPQPAQQTTPMPAAVIVPEPKPRPAAVLAPQPAPVAVTPAPVRPKARPAALVPARAEPPQPAPSRPALSLPKEAPLAQSSDEVDETLNAIGLSVVQQLMQQTAPAAEPEPRVAVAPAPAQPVVTTPRPVPTAAPQTVQYVVKEGDSLPGLAFRFFGTTAAYLSIVEANPILRDNPNAFAAGMTIEIPKTP